MKILRETINPTEYKVITAALERLGHGYESVENSIQRMIEEFPNILR